MDLFRIYFPTLDKFGIYYGCKLNLLKADAIWIGSKRGTNYFPFSDKGLSWISSTFKTFGIIFLPKY